MRSVGETDPFACIFKGNPSLSHSANSYFTVVADDQDASDLISEMEAAYNATPRNVSLARSKGYELLTLVGLVSRQNTGSSPEVGELLTKQSFNCMYETGPNGADAAGFAGWPDDAHYDFSAALTPGIGGAYYVKGGSSVSPAIGNLASLNTPSQPAAGNVSAIAPPFGDQWSEVLSQVAGNTVLFFGNTVTDGYDWKVQPRNASFSPYALVALCPGVNGGQVYDGADMVFQESVGVVGFEEVGTLCSINPAPPFAGLYHPGGVFAALGRVFHSTGQWFSPQPLHASLVTTATIGGKVSGAKADEFTFENVPTVDLDLSLADLLQPKNRLKVNSGRFSVTTTRDAALPLWLRPRRPRSRPWDRTERPP
jgi:hypothetical protein